MRHTRDTIALPLFVPADRPERYAKAFQAGADAVIIDLEDAVAPPAKDTARQALLGARDVLAQAPIPVLLRINARGTPHHEADLAAARALPGVAAVMLAKAETPADVAELAAIACRPVVALIESARGLAAARAIAVTGARLAFGSIDFAADLGCAHTRDALLLARTELVLASRLAGKLLIHPAQIAPARAGLRPTAAETAWAERVFATNEGGAAALDGAMVDAPVRLRAEQIRRRAGAVQ